jgi:DNA-binding winged helix-turn-helix (wHTH) protein
LGTNELAFGQFRLDRTNALLWRGEERITLAPKPFEVLCCLAERAGELVTKDELLDAVWSDIHVSESSLAVAVNALRTALGDDRQAPRYIETVTRRGYRFIAPVTAARASEAATARPGAAATSDEAADRRGRWRVGRAAPLEAIEGILQHVVAGRRQIAFVTGEAGIGKSTFVQMALERMRQHGYGVLHCACNELFGTREAFLPLIEALHEGCRTADGAALLAALRDHAPTWLAQMPGFLGDEERSVFQQEVFGATRERMLREFVDLMEGLAARTPWVIVLEDLHWSDFATVDVLSRLARRDRKAALLVLATYRPMEVAVGDHPIRTVHQDLQIHGLCQELALDRLSADDVERYLALRFNSADLARQLAERVFARTGGQPLFVVSLVDHLVAQGVLIEQNGAWRLGRDDAAAHDSMPRDLHGMITRQIDHLTADERAILEIASAAGTEFSALQVASVQDRSVLEVEEACEELARTARIITSVGVTEWPNGELSGRYAFKHALYQEILYQRLAPARRVNTHARLGATLERGYGSKAQEVASELAFHFELGRDFAKAARYLALAADNSARRFSPREAANYLTRALDAVSHLPAEVQVATRLQLLLQRAWAWRAAGDFVRSIEDLRAVVAHAAGNALLRQEVNGLVDLSRFYLYLDPRLSLPLAEEALAKSRAIDDPAFRALVQGNAANLRMMLKGWSNEDAAFCAHASELIGDSQDLSMRMRRCSMEVVVEFLRADYAACSAAADRGKTLVRIVGDIYLFALYNMVQSYALLYLGEWGRLQTNLRSTLAISERNANTQASALSMLTLGWLYAEAQEFERAVESAEATLNPAVEDNPSCFFIGRNLLVGGYLGLGKLAEAGRHLQQIAHRIEVDGVPIESAVIPHYLLNRFECGLATDDLDQARRSLAELFTFTQAAPDRPFLALAHRAAARLAMRTQDVAAARHHLGHAVSLLRSRTAPFAAWRVYASVADHCEAAGQHGKAETWRSRSRDAVSVLKDSLEPADPLRSIPFFARTATAAQAAPASEPDRLTL